MCGIAGILPLGESAGLSDVRERLGAMVRAMRHRGPDDTGMYIAPDGRGGLGNTRLAIRDLSPAGHMPMASADGRTWITYNGEIYNAAELRGELERLGFAFRSTGDTEVILNGYLAWGVELPIRLNGIFAFAVWDETARTLLLSRDRFGVKPLYYASAGNDLVFASEVRALLASGLIPRVADRQAVEHYLMFGSCPSGRTIIAGVSGLPRASYASVAAAADVSRHDSADVDVKEYWSQAGEFAGADPIPDSELEERARETFKVAVHSQMASDVPVGLFLSDGTDSTALAAFMRATTGSDIRSVTVGFDEARFDESDRSRSTADRFCLDHAERRIGPAEVLDSLPEVIAAMDQPTIDGVNTYFVSQTAAQSGLKVALAGLGADELFGGYRTFADVPRVDRLMRQVSALPFGPEGGRALADIPGVPYRWRKLGAWLTEGASGTDAYAAVRGVLSPRRVASLLGEPKAISASLDSVELNGSLIGNAAAVSLLESSIYMHNQLLRDTDCMAMAHSLEVRVPYLDASTSRLAVATVGAWSQSAKAPLKLARSIYFPIGLPDKPKQGFTFPFDPWLRGPLRPLVQQLTAADVVVSRSAWVSLVNDFDHGRAHWSHVWAPIVLDRWLRENDVSLGPRAELASAAA